MDKAKKIKFDSFTWIHLEKPSEQEIRHVGQEYKFHPLDISDSVNISHRSKIDTYPQYCFLLFLFPIYNRATRTFEESELDIFIGKNYLITINQGNLTALNDFFNLFRLSSDLRMKYTDRSPERLLYEILNKLIFYCYPMIDHLILDCNNIEKAIFSGKERKMVSEILIIRRNITDFRKIMQVHRSIVKKLIHYLKENKNFVLKKTDVYFESIVDYTEEIWDMLDNLKERIEALQNTNESQISFKLSDTMRILTVISVIILPISFVAAVFGMNTTHAMPFLEDPQGFWYIISLMAAIMIGMIATFKYKDWL